MTRSKTELAPVTITLHYEMTKKSTPAGQQVFTGKMPDGETTTFWTKIGLVFIHRVTGQTGKLRFQEVGPDDVGRHLHVEVTHRLVEW